MTSFSPRQTPGLHVRIPSNISHINNAFYDFAYSDDMQSLSQIPTAEDLEGPGRPRREEWLSASRVNGERSEKSSKQTHPPRKVWRERVGKWAKKVMAP
jgi:hypothetical protein